MNIIPPSLILSFLYTLLPLFFICHTASILYSLISFSPLISSLLSSFLPTWLRSFILYHILSFHPSFHSCSHIFIRFSFLSRFPLHLPFPFLPVFLFSLFLFNLQHSFFISYLSILSFIFPFFVASFIYSFYFPVSRFRLSLLPQHPQFLLSPFVCFFPHLFLISSLFSSLLVSLQLYFPFLSSPVISQQLLSFPLHSPPLLSFLPPLRGIESFHSLFPHLYAVHFSCLSRALHFLLSSFPLTPLPSPYCSPISSYRP